jgi:hypothetical protein
VRDGPTSSLVAYVFTTNAAADVFNPVYVALATVHVHLTSLLAPINPSVFAHV